MLLDFSLLICDPFEELHIIATNMLPIIITIIIHGQYANIQNAPKINAPTPIILTIAFTPDGSPLHKAINAKITITIKIIGAIETSFVSTT